MLQFESVVFEKGITITYDVDGGIIVNGDEARFRRLCAILLDNSFKYASADGRGEVRVSLSRAKKTVTLSVANNGRAIPEEELLHVFDRFYRVDDSRSRAASASVCPENASMDDMSDGGGEGATGGFGLGLAVVSRIAQEHHGALKSSSSHSNTTFTFTLPAAANS